jgi:hypothetical protein
LAVTAPLARIGAALQWRVRKLGLLARHFPIRLEAWLGFKRNVHRHRILSEAELLQTRRSDTVFIFGSGYSLNAISPAAWRAIEAHDTVGFNWFVHQQFVRCDYHLVREIGPTDLDPRIWRKYLLDYFERLRGNARFSNAVWLVQTGFRATNGNRAIWLRQIPEHQRVFLWKSADSDTPSTTFADGLAHRHGTLHECINFAALMGWTRIVLAGVDLYDRRYFWLREDEGRADDGEPHDAIHRTALAGVVDSMRMWNELLRRRGVELYVYNPQSLLVKVLPVWNAVTT